MSSAIQNGTSTLGLDVCRWKCSTVAVYTMRSNDSEGAWFFFYYLLGWLYLGVKTLGDYNAMQTNMTFFEQPKKKWLKLYQVIR